MLKSDTRVKEGKGIQYFSNGTVLDGYFQKNNFIKGRIIDVFGNQVSGSFQN